MKGLDNTEEKVKGCKSLDCDIFRIKCSLEHRHLLGFSSYTYKGYQNAAEQKALESKIVPREPMRRQRASETLGIIRTVQINRRNFIKILF